MSEKKYRNVSRAQKLLKTIASLDGNKGAAEMDFAASQSADPDMALLQFVRLIETLSESKETSDLKYLIADKEAIAVIAAVFGGSDYLSQFIISDNHRIHDFLNSPYLRSLKPYDAMKKELDELCAGVIDRWKMMGVLRNYRKAEMLRITARDLMEWAQLEDITRELSDLASATTHCAYRFARAELARQWGEPFEADENSGERRPARFVVLGMGKLGGCELNYSSDIDLIYLYGSDGGSFDAPRENHSSAGKTMADFWSKVAEEMSQLIGEVTEDGLVFRVDLRLRPHGGSGAVATAMDSAVEYYLTWGQTWERAALLKARPMAGDIKLGEEFLCQIEPWLHRRYLDFGLLDEIQEMKVKYDIEARRAGRGSWDVKLGSGGIREIEFFAQSMQLVHGGKIPSIRQKNTLNALHSLNEAGLISSDDATELSDAYRFLRKLEHRIQIQEFQQTQRLPKKPEDRDRIAALMGFHGPYDGRWAEFEEKLDSYRAEVGERYRGLFVAPREDAKLAVAEEAILLARGELAETEGRQWLAKRGFADPAGAYRALERLREGPRRLAYLSDATRHRWRDIAPLLIQEVAAAPGPDMALTNLERFLAGVGARATTLALLRQHPATAKFIVSLFGTSEYLSEFFISRPELLDALVGPRRSAPTFDPEAMRVELDESLSAAADLEERLDVLRLFVHERMLRIGLEDLAGEADHQAISGRLSALAEVALGGAYRIARIEIESRFGEPVFRSNGGEIRGGLAVLGMGKLGGDELSYGSDLDVIFVYHPSLAETGKGLSSHEYFVKLAQRIISAINIETAQGHCYSLDTRLRPSGRAGSLVTSLDSFEKYHRDSSAAWERQALIKMRPVAGDMALGKKVLDAVRPFIFDRPLTDAHIEEIRHVRKRMAEEMSRSTGERIDLKLEPGGLVDAEFVVQIMQLLHGAGKPELHTPNTVKAIESLRGIMDESDRQALFEGWNFLRKVALRLRITSAPESPVLEISGRGTLIVARSLGYSEANGDPIKQLLSEIRSNMKKIKELYGKYV